MFLEVTKQKDNYPSDVFVRIESVLYVSAESCCRLVLKQKCTNRIVGLKKK